VPGATGIVVIDDDWVALSRLREFIEQNSEFVVVAACRCADGAMLAVRHYRPAVVILDVRLPDRDGVELIRDIAAISTVKVIIYTTAPHKEGILSLLRNGAKAVVPKDQPVSVLVSCVRNVLAAEPCLSQHVTTEDVANGGSRAGGVLSPREQEIAQWVLAGARNKEIAWQLGISQGTVKHHLFSMYRKFKVDNRIGLMLALTRTIAIGCITLVDNQSLIA
jgi:DNA-binding NarL/FixJ family response regulator